MSLSLAIIVIVLADLAVIGLVTFAMSRAKLLRPHISTAEEAVQTPTATARRVSPLAVRPRPAGARPQPTAARSRLIEAGRPPH
jgi:hypothetical protein